MKPVGPLLALSLVANVALASWVWQRAQERPSATTVATTPAHRSQPKAPPPAEALTPAIARERLAALGLPDDIVRAVVRAMIEEPRLAREREYHAALGQLPWWQGKPGFTAAQERELRALRKAEREEILRVLGPLGYAADEQLERYSYLSAEKAARLVTLQRDYAELRREAAELTQGNPAEAQERQKLLTTEHERDLAALLTPAERLAFDERESSSARNLSYRFEFFNATEAEYRAVFALQKTFDENFSGGPRGISGDRSQAFGEAMRTLTEDIKTTLGPERYAAFLQSQRTEYRALVELQRRYQVPQTAFDQAVKVHADISSEGAIIAENGALSNAQKRDALAALADRASAGIRQALGPTIGDSFLAATASNWIDVMKRGGMYFAQPTGGSSVRTFSDRSSVTPATPANPPRPAPGR